MYLHQIEKYAKDKVPIDLGNSMHRIIGIRCQIKSLSNSHIHYITTTIDSIYNHKESYTRFDLERTQLSTLHYKLLGNSKL